MLCGRNCVDELCSRLNISFIYGSVLIGYILRMIRVIYIIVLCALVSAIGPVASAASCRDIAAARVNAKKGAQILGVRSEKGAYGKTVCVVTVRLRGKPGMRPRVVTRKFRP